MYDSGVSYSQIVSDLKKEVDVSVKVPMRIYVEALNYVQQLIYGDVVHEYGILSYEPNKATNMLHIEPMPNNNNPSTTAFKITLTDEPTDQDGIRYEDITQVYYNGVELHRFPLRECLLIPNSYARYEGFVVINVDKTFVREGSDVAFTVIYNKRPIQIRNINDNITEGNVALPNEFLGLAKSYMRGAAYKYANEDGLAAKYISDFNNLLETFKMWVQSHK